MTAPLARAPWLVTAAVAGDTVIYDPVRDALHVLDRTATDVWDLLDGRRPVSGIVAALTERYGAGGAIGEDVPALLAHLSVAHLSVEGALVPIGSIEGPLVERVSASRVPSTRFDRPAGPVGTPETVRVPQFAPTSRTTLPPQPVPAAHTGRTPQPVPAPRTDLRPGIDPAPGTVFRALDYTFSVSADDPTLEAHVHGALRDLADGSADCSAHYRLRSEKVTIVIEADGASIAAPVTPQRAPHLLLWHINQEAVRRSSERCVILHAAVAERGGRAVILPGAMERGKTTTVAGLVRSGYRYLSDELAAIDAETLLIRPYPKPLGIDPGAQRVLADLRPAAATDDVSWQVAATAIRTDAITAVPVEPAIIVAPEYDPSATTVIEPLSAARMLVHLADCCFGFKDHPARDLAVLASVVQSCACYRLVISDLDDAVALITGVYQEVGAAHGLIARSDETRPATTP